MIMSGGPLGSVLMRFLAKLVKPTTSVLKNVIAPLGLSTEMSDIDGAIQIKKHTWNRNSRVIFFHEEINENK